ncbi:MAG TPA: glycosyltransferase [Alkalispirochaeta sp.]|nr:glycosyltransferase [Alkalispirochaeta sp.]
MSTSTPAPTMYPKISIIVPTLNERKLLPVLIESIHQQDFTDYEVIIADAGSDDGTREYADEQGCRVVEGGLPARGRNAGAAAARGEFLFFLDSDVRLPEDFLANAWEEIERKFVDLATCEARPITDVSFDKLLFNFASTVTRLTVRTQPRATGFCILVTKRLFRRVGGFDETITLGEDHAFSKAAAEFRRLEFLSSTYVEVSVRRLDKEGRVGYLLKAIHSDLHRRLIGEIRNNAIEYDFAHYDEADPDQPNQNFVARLDRWLLQADEGLRNLVESTRDLPSPNDPDQELGERLEEQFDQLRRGLRKRLKPRKDQSDPPDSSNREV